MRLPRINDGHRLLERFKLGFVGLIVGRRPDVLRTLLYRPELFGRAFSKLTQAVMRGPSAWQVSDREIIAMFVSQLNQCPF